jgi:hypothetical protein
MTLLPACGGRRGATTRFVVAHQATQPPSSDVRCVPTSGTLDDLTLQMGKIATLRLSLRKHAVATDAGAFGCDIVLHVPSDVPSVRLPPMGPIAPQTVDIYAEGFDAAPAGIQPHRVAVGSLLGVSPMAPTLPDVRLYPADSFRCLKPPMSRPRAFHSATLLPNNQVLIIGGLVASPTNPSAESIGLTPLYVTSDVEVYDPAKGSFTIVMDKSANPIARAFHQVALLDGMGPKFSLIVVGGVTAPDPMQPVLGLNTGAAPGPRLVPFDTSMSILNPLSTRAATTAELIEYDPATTSLTRTKMPGLTAAAFQGSAPFGDGIAVAGGIDWGEPLEMETPDTNVGVVHGTETARSGMLAAARIGATLTALDDTTALVWGGAIQPSDPIGELVTGLAAGKTVTSTAVTTMGQVATQFHTATLLGLPGTADSHTLLVTGGFVETTTSMGSALEPPAAGEAARLVTVTTATGAVTVAPVNLASPYITDATCTMNNRYRGAGWEAAAVTQGKVLVCGGAPTYLSMPPCDDCDGGSGLYCATRQASLFTPPSTLAPVTEPLQVPRFGHTATTMRDGNVLVLGGIGAGSGTPRVIADGEEYNPRPFKTTFSTSMMPSDPDDPLGADMKAMGYVRAPGKQAVKVGSTTAAQPCGEL